MNTEIKTRILLEICKLSRTRSQRLLEKFDLFIDFYSKNKDMPKKDLVIALKYITKLPPQSIKYLIEVSDKEILNSTHHQETGTEYTIAEILQMNKKEKLEAQRKRIAKYEELNKSRDPYFDLKKRIYRFCGKGGVRSNIAIEDFIKKFGENPVCYISGEPLDLNNLDSLVMDHIVPKCQGGSNELSNLGLCTKQANLCKAWYTFDEFLMFCQKVLEYNKKRVRKLNKIEDQKRIIQ